MMDILEIQTDEKYGGAKDKTSQFHFIFNTNLASKSFLDMSPEIRKGFVRSLTEAAQTLIHDINKYIKVDSPKTKPKLLNRHIGLEIGKTKRHIHLDGYLQFDKRCLLNLKEMETLFNNSMKSINQKGFLNVKFVPDMMSRALNYSKKDGMTLV